MVSADAATVAHRLIAQAGGRPTKPRVAVLLALLETARTLSHADVHRRLPDLDRVSVYRVLDWLADQGLAHRITDSDGVRRYGPSRSTGDHQHPHFHCLRCGFTICLDPVASTAVRVPMGFRLDAIEILVRGLCQTCVGLDGDRTR